MLLPLRQKHSKLNYTGVLELKDVQDHKISCVSQNLSRYDI